MLIRMAFFLASVRVFAGEIAYCAFEVKVTTAAGTPRPNVPVFLIREHKTTFSDATTDESGLARLCDAPLEAVDVVVGFDVCGLVTVRNLHSLWPDTKRINVIFEEHPCEHFALAEYCQVLLRVQDTEGRAVAGVRFSGDLDNKGSGSDVSDNLGRIFRLVKRHGKLEGVVKAERGGQARVSLLVTDDTELKLVLHK